MPKQPKPPSIRDRVVDFRRVPASQLIPNPKNWRVHNDAQKQAFQSIVSSIGFAGAELVREMPDGRLMLIDGHMRADTLGDMPVPCLVTDLSEHEADALLATFDPIGRLAGTDQDAAAALIESLGVAGYDAAADLLRAVADNDQTSALLESLADGMLGGGDASEAHDVDDPSGGGDDFDTTPDDGPTRCQPGDIWALGEHRLLCGDSTKREDVARLMDGERDALLLTDPPYGINLNSEWQNDVHRKHGKALNYNAGSIANDNGEITAEMFTGWPRRVVFGFPYLHDVNASGWLVWDKEPGFEGRSLTTPVEMAYSTTWRGFRIERLLWSGYMREAGSEAKVGHPTQKPLRLISNIIEQHSDTAILDLFLGSGTTLIACERTGRRCYGIEIDPSYCDVILRRWEAETGRTATLLERISEPEHATA